MKILAVDPGSKTTGVVVRQGDRLLDHALVEGSLLETVDAVAGLDYRHTPDLIACEDLVEPTPQMGITSVKGLMETAQVIGALRISFDCVMVRPSGFGKGWLAGYRVKCETHNETCLVGKRESKGAGIRRHLRSAYDVAGAASVVARQQKFAG